MKKLFISQPMKGKTDEEILKERKALIAKAEEVAGEKLDDIDSFFTDAPKDKNNIVTEPVWWLGKSLMKLAEADVAIFGDGWKNYNGCCVEHEVCERYKIEILKD